MLSQKARQIKVIYILVFSQSMTRLFVFQKNEVILYLEFAASSYSRIKGG